MDYYLGQIQLFPFNFTPQYWTLCNGQILNIQQNTALFSLLGTKYGGNGTTNFALPNLTNTSPVAGTNYCIAISGIYPSRQ